MNSRLYELTAGLPIGDTHEHIITSGVLKRHSRGLIELIGEAYLHDDVISAGAAEEMFSQSLSDEVRWERIKPHLFNTANTSYYRSLVMALNDLFDMRIANIDDGNWRELDARLKNAACQGEAWYESVLHKKANIRHCMRDKDRVSNTEVELWQGKGLKSIQDEEFEPRFFRRVARTDLLLNVVFKAYRPEIERVYGVDICELDDIDALIRAFAVRSEREGAVCYKSVAAYFRSLSFASCVRDSAAASLRAILAERDTTEDRMRLQDYMIHALLQEADRRAMPFQFHTGMQALNANTVDNANPLRLNTLFLRYPNVCFIMLHGGYPYAPMAGVLAKKFENVMLDFSWLPQIGYTAAVHAASEWFDIVPMNKITWGGDCRHVENAYAAVILFRKLMYEVLSAKVADGMIDNDTAARMAERIMYRNAEDIYKL
ncbi:MAG: amidohydrolase family protein [Clostridia bacterium]